MRKGISPPKHIAISLAGPFAGVSVRRRRVSVKIALPDLFADHLGGRLIKTCYLSIGGGESSICCLCCRSNGGNVAYSIEHVGDEETQEESSPRWFRCSCRSRGAGGALGRMDVGSFSDGHLLLEQRQRGFSNCFNTTATGACARCSTRRRRRLKAMMARTAVQWRKRL